MNAYGYLASSFLISFLFSCSSTDKKDPILKEAVRYHDEATQIQAVLEPKIEGIDSIKVVMAKQLTSSGKARMASLDSLKAAFEEWETNLVEVPGMPHNHSHGKGEHEHHNHTDATLKDLPADQMRDLQRETLNSIRQMQSRFETLTQSH